MIRVDQVDRPSGRTGWSDESVEMMLRHHGVDALGARHPEIPGERLAVFLRREGTFLLCLEHYLLAEPRHLSRLVALVERNDVLQRFYSSLRSKRREIGVEICFELVEKNLEFGVVEFS